MDKKLITLLADDVWAVAKQLERTDNLKLCDEIKKISGCLHDIRTDSNTDWYLKVRGNK